MNPRDDRPFGPSVLAAVAVLALMVLAVVVTAGWLLLLTGVLTWR